MQVVGRQAPVSRLAYPARVLCRLVDLNFLARASVPDPIMNMWCWIIVDEISALGTRGPAAVLGVHCRARRAAATRRGVGEAGHRCQPVEAWCRSRRAKRAAAAIRQGVPYIYGTPRPTAASVLEQLDHSR